MHLNGGKGGKELDDIVAVRYGIHAVGGGLVKVKQLGGVRTVKRVGGAGEGTCSERACVHSSADIGEAASVAAEHFEICAEVMCESNRLRFLQMGEAGHIGFRVLLNDPLDHKKKLLQDRIKLVNFVPHIKLHIQSNLVVPASSGVELFAHIADPVDEIRLDKAVDIFILVGNSESAVLDIPQDAVQSVDDLIPLMFSEDSLLCEHPHMCKAAADVLPVEFLIKAD